MRWLAMLVVLAACDGDLPRKRPKVELTPGEAIAPSVQGTAQEPPPPVTISGLVASGQYWRLATQHGPVHVWIPKGYDRRRAETIVYVHGYYIHVDGAWKDYELPKKFAAAGINAVFIACEGPASPQESVSWPALAPLLDDVERGIAQKLPRRRVVAFGHSAAYRTLLGWLDEPLLDTVVLLDAAYGEIEQYKAWVLADEHHRLIDIGDDTRAWTDKLHADLPDSLVIDGFPSVEDGIPREASKARVVYIKSNLGHFPLVTNDTAIPMILRTLRARRIMREPLAEILATP